MRRGMAAGGFVARNWPARPAVPLIARFLGKFVLDIMPAALASVIGGFLFTQYQFGRAPAPHPVLETVTPASAEMMALVRDEHAMIIDYLKSQMAAEKSRATVPAAADRDTDTDDVAALAAVPAYSADPQGGAEIKPARAKMAVEKAAVEKVALQASARHIAAAVAAAKAAEAHSRTAAASSPQAPLVIAMAEQSGERDDGAADGALPAGRIARDPNSLLAKTLDLKDHVVAATRHAVSAIGDMIGSVGERIGGGGSTGPRQFSSAS